MHKKIISFSIIAILLLGVFNNFYNASSELNNSFTSQDFKFYKKLDLPIDTSLSQAKYQPIDIKIIFNETCWAKNTIEHSIRVKCLKDKIWYELDSQIYDLKKTDANFISECKIVFLIPDFADGTEIYYVFYDDIQKPAPNYEDHIKIVESYEKRNPISGINLESYHYEISQDDQIIYGIAYDGKSLNSRVCQDVTKFKPGSKDTRYSNGDQLAGFKFYYWYKIKNEKGQWKWTDTPIVADNVLEHDILVDGNLMCKVMITSVSDENRIKTSNVYTYYYNPTDQKKLKVHVKNEVLKDQFPVTEEIDLSYVVLSSGGCKSTTIPEMNFGCILPYMHVYEEKELIQPFNINTCPASSKTVMDIHKSHDIDLGSKAWVSLDEGEIGKAHGIIFNTTNIVKRGENERQGIEIQHLEQKNTVVQGALEMITSMFYLGRNMYENGTEDEDVPKDLIVEFDCEFFTTETGGYKTVDEESEIFQKLNNFQPSYDTDISTGKKQAEAERYNITAFARLGWSFPFGSLINQFVESLKTAYITIELYKDGRMISSGIAERCPTDLERAAELLEEDVEFRELFLVKKYRDEIFDHNNWTIYKSVNFNNLLPGDYVIKTYVISPLYNRGGKELIAYETVKNLSEDIEVGTVCGIPGMINYKIVDQNQIGIKDSDVYILKDNLTISHGKTDEKGEINFKIPILLYDNIKLRVIHKGFIVDEQNIDHNFLNVFIPAKHNGNADIYNFEIKIFDSDGKPVDDAVLYLYSEEMFEEIDIYPDEQKNGVFLFKDLPAGSYNIFFKYKSYEVMENIDIPNIDSYEINLHDLNLRLYDQNGLPPDVEINVILKSDDFEKSVMLSGKKTDPGIYVFKNLYPGEYSLLILYRDYKIEENIDVPYEESDFLEVDFDVLYTLSLKLFDRRGDSLDNADVEIFKDGFRLEKQVTEGSVNLSIPPGTYNIRVESDDEIVAAQKIDFKCDIEQDIISSKRPITYTLFFVIILILGFILSAFLLYKKDFFSFAILLVIILVLISVISPWWMIYGYKEKPIDLESNTYMYLMPSTMVSVISNTDIIGGEISSLPEIFTDVLSILSYVLIAFVIILSSYLIFYRLGRIKKRFISVFLSLFILIASVSGFYFTTSMLTESSIGPFMGSGNLDVMIPGEGYYETLSSSWGASIGFYLVIVAIIILIIILLYQFRKNYEKKKKQTFFCKEKMIKYFKKIMPFIGFFILIYLLFDIGFEEIKDVVLKISPVFILLSATLVIPRILIGTYIWYYILRKQKIKLRYWKAFKIYLMGIFYASVTPGYWGRFVIIPYVKDETGEPVGKLFVNTILKSAITTLSLYTMMIIGAFILVEKIPELMPVTIATVGGTLIAYFFFMKKERGEKTFHLLIKIFIPKKIKNFFTSFVDTFYKDFPDPVIFIIPYILGFLIFFLIYAQIYILSIPLDFPIPFTTFLFLYTIGNVAAFLPISSGGVGVREALLIYIFGLYGVDAATALVVSLGGHLISDVLTGVYGLVVAFVEARNNKKKKMVNNFKKTLEHAK